MRPAACTQQRVSVAVDTRCKPVAVSFSHLSSRQTFGRHRVQCRQQPPRTVQRERLGVVAAQISRRPPPQVPGRRPCDPTECSAPAPVQAQTGFKIEWKPIFRVLLLVPVLFLPAVFLPRAAIGATAKSLAVPSVRTVEVWPCTHTPHQQTVSSISDSTTSPSPISTTAVSLSSPQEVEQAHSFDHAHSDQSAGAVSSSRDTVVTQLDHIVAEHNTTQVVAAVALAILLLLALKSNQTKHAGSQLRDVERPIPVQPPSSDRSSSLATPQSPPNDDDVDDEYDDYEEENSHPSSESGLSVEQRRRQASKDIAAAKARQAAFVSQGRSQFTDTDAAQPKVPDFSDDSDASATATTILDKTQTPRSERYSPDSGPRRPDASSATDTFALDDPTPRPDSSASSSRQRQQSSSEPDSFKPTYAQGSSDRKPRLDGEDDAREQAQAETMRMPSPKFPSVTARQGPAKGADRLVSAPAGPNFPGPKFPSVTSRQGPARGADRPVSAPAGEVSESRSATPEPSPAKLGGRTGDQEARQKAVPELQQPLEQRATSDKEASSSVPEAARRQSSARDSQSGVRDSAEQSDWLSDKNQTSKLASSLASSSMSAKPSEQSRSKSSQSVSPTSGSGKTGGRTPPGEQNARQEAMAGLQRKGKQPTALDQQAATIFVDRPQAQPDSDSSSSQADSEQPSRAPAQGQTSSVLPPSGRAPAGEHEAREKAMSELKKQSQQTQPAQSADLQKIRDQAKDQQQGKDQGLGISTQQAAAVYKPQSPGSEQNQPQQQSGWLSDKNQTSKLASSLASSSTSAKPSDRDPSNAQPSSPARTEQSPNRVRDFFAGVQSRLSGRNAQSPGMGFASSTSTAPQTDQPSSPMQAQVPAQDATAAQRMASANQAQAAEQARQQPQGEITVRKYQPVDLPGSVGDFVKSRGVRAPLLLLYGLAASAAQAMEPLLPVKQQGKAEDGMLDVEAVDWGQLCKYDIFQQMLNAAASSPTAQEERFSPLRSLANAVPSDKGIPKYDFLRDLLRSAAQPRNASPSSKALTSSSSSGSGPDLSGLLPSLDPLAALLQDAKQPWRSADSKYDPFNAFNRALATSEEPTGSTAALDPLGNLLRPDQARQGDGKPNQAARSKYDPFQTGWRSNAADAPSSSASPRRRKAFRPRLPVKSKYDIFQQIFKAEGPTSDTATLDPLGQVLQSLRQPWDRPPSSKYDVFQAIFALEGPDAQKPRSERQQGDSAQAKDSVKSKYDVFQALFSMEEPDTQRPALDPLSALQGNTASEPAESVKSKYDPFQALFNLQGPDARRPGSRPETPSQPTESVKSKYDPFQALFQSEGPSSDTAELDPFKNFLQRLQRPRQRTSSKYDVIQALMKVQGPSRQAASFDPFGAALRDSKQPRQTLRSKYDPFQALFESQMPDGKAAWDPLPHLIKAMTASSLLKKQQEQQQRQRPIRSSSPARSDKYNPVQQLLSAEPPTGRTPGFDPLGSLLKSPWVKEKRSRKQQTPSREGDSRDFVPVYASARPGSPSKWASQTPVRNQKFTPDQSGRAPAGEHEARDRAMADLQAKAKGRGEDDDDTSGRPSEWAGFVYNPYSGDLLPQEDDDENSLSSGGSGAGPGASSRGKAAGQGKPQFVSANPSARPVSKTQALKDEATTLS